MADDSFPCETDKPKKRKIVGRKTDANKLARLSGHQIGEDCKCTRHKCFEVTNDEERQCLITSFNRLETKNLQDSFLSTLIQVENVARRRPRCKPKDDDDVPLNLKPKDKSYKYVIRLPRRGGVEEIDVCLKGFLAIFGIGHKRVRTIQTALKETGLPPQDMRGRHDNRPAKMSDDLTQQIKDHISSFKGRVSHYSRVKSKRVYLPQTLTITKMHSLFLEHYPAESVSYESYRKIFNDNFNVSFGHPRSDTCSICDECQAQLDSFAARIKADPGIKDTLEPEKVIVMQRMELHQRKADTFYNRKRAAKARAKKDSSLLAVAFDFHKELPIPNKTTNDIFYRRQLSLHSFNIHELAGENVYVYAYDETIGKRGSDDVASMLHHFILNYIPDCVKSLELFCDGCAGQNKNWTVLRFLFSLIHFWKRFEKVKVTFPIRGHSYMECDRDLTVVDKRRDVELPRQWMEQFMNARQHPSPHNVIEVQQNQLFRVGDYLKPLFKATCPVATRPIREVVFSRDSPMLMLYRNNWNGLMESAVVVPRLKCLPTRVAARLATDMEPQHTSPLPISEAKFRDLQVLKRFCDPRNHDFYDSLPHDGRAPNGLLEPLSESESEEE